MRCAPAFVTPKNGYGLWVTGYRLPGQKSKVERQKTSFYFERSGLSTLRRKAPVYKKILPKICMGGIFFVPLRPNGRLSSVLLSNVCSRVLCSGFFI